MFVLEYEEIGEGGGGRLAARGSQQEISKQNRVTKFRFTPKFLFILLFVGHEL